MKKIQLLTVMIGWLLGSNVIQAQCNTNTSICNLSQSTNFTFVTPGSPVSTCLDFFGPNVGYIVLYITQSGQLNMLIDGNASTGFLDVAVFNIPNGVAPCTAIQNTANEIGCNYASASNGCAQFGTSFPCTSSIPAPSVTAGQTLMIVVENWSGSSSSFTLQLSSTPGSAQTGAPNATINPAGPFCQSAAPFQLTATNQGGTWSGPGTSASGLFNPATAGIGTHTINYSIGQSPCQSTSSTQITVNSNGSIAVTPSNATICPGGSVSLTASGSGNYVWSPASGLSTTSGATVSASPSATTTYTVNGSQNGCSATGSVTVTVGSSPVVTATSNAPICLGETLELSANSDAGATYSWSGPGNFSSTDQNPVLPNATAANEGIYTVTVDVNGCSNTATTTVTLNPTVTPVITAVNPVCENNGTITLSATPPGGTWSGTGITSPALFDPNVANPGTHTITYDLAPLPCGGSATTSITVNPIPDVEVSVSGTVGCEPFTVTLSDASIPSSQSITWDFGDGSPVSTSIGAQTHEFVNPGCYSVTVSSSSNGCSNTETFPNLVCVVANPVAEFTVSDFTANIFFPSFNFINQSTDATQYVWTFGDGAGSTVLNPSHTYAEMPGEYEVTLVAVNQGGCSDTVSKFVQVLEELIFYVPNAFTPDGDEYNNVFTPVFTSGFDPFNYNLTIFNRWGEILFESQDHLYGWDGTYQGLPVPEGSYVWRLNFKDSRSDKRYQHTGHFTVLR